tara:strand:+ start:1196 stop:1318 length:123 start_codon:yes stop_codon:yes gene_type:complete
MDPMDEKQQPSIFGNFETIGRPQLRAVDGRSNPNEQQTQE